MRFFLLAFLFLGVLSAHSLKIFAKEEDGKIAIKSYFYGGSPCKNCQVELLGDEQVLLSGKTDDRGLASFALPSKKDFIIKVYAGSGHFKEIPYALKAENSVISNNASLESESILAQILKGFGSILAILAIFAIIYFTKNRKKCLLS